MEIRQYRAAGGIVVRDAQALLLYKHALGETVLPKGHVEPGETLEEAALRETREETGYVNLRILADLGTERAEFEHQGKRVVRDETYFVMELIDEARDEAQNHDAAEHDRTVFERRWMPLKESASRMSFEPARTFVARAAAWVEARR